MVYAVLALTAILWFVVCSKFLSLQHRINESGIKVLGQIVKRLDEFVELQVDNENACDIEQDDDNVT